MNPLTRSLVEASIPPNSSVSLLLEKIMEKETKFKLCAELRAMLSSPAGGKNLFFWSEVLVLIGPASCQRGGSVPSGRGVSLCPGSEASLCPEWEASLWPR